MWFTLLAPLVSTLFGKDGIVGTYFQTKQKIEQTRQEAQLQIEIATLDYNKQQGINAVESEKNKLAATSSGFKYTTFILINIPVIIICLSPSRGRDIFENFALIPVWYAQLYAAIYGIIWGLPVAASAMSSIFTAIQAAWANRQDKKIEKIQAMGEANGINTEQAKKEIFDIMKKTVGLNGFSQPQVDAISPVLDKVLQIQKEAGK